MVQKIHQEQEPSLSTVLAWSTVPHCMTEILAKDCKSGKSTVLVLGTVSKWKQPFSERRAYHEKGNMEKKVF